MPEGYPNLPEKRFDPEATLMILELLQSSARRAMVFSGSTASGRSHMNMTKNSGPKREPCGTPEETSDQDDETPSKTTLCCLWLK